MKKTAQENSPSEWLAEYDTGIYRDPPRILVPAKGPAFDRYIAENNARYDLHTQLAEAEQFAREILGRYQGTDGRPVPPSKAKGIPDNVRRQVDYALSLRAQIHNAREHAEKGDILTAGVHAFWVGRYYEALRVLQEEHHAARGRKTLRAAQRGGHGRATDPQTEANWKTRADALRQEVPGISDLAAAEIISREIGGNVETIRKKIRRTR